MEQKKKIFPKIKKRLSDFLTDESGGNYKKGCPGCCGGGNVVGWD